jgi:hypothetical protein
MRIISTKQDLQKYLTDSIMGRPPVGTFSDSIDRTLWLDPSVQNGRSEALSFWYGGYRYRVHANCRVDALAALVADMDTYSLTGISMTQSTGERCDACNRKSVRVGLYVYRKVR